MDELLDSIAALVSLVSREKVQAIATRVRRTEISNARTALPNVVGTPVASAVMEHLAAAWQNSKVSSNELALMLFAAGHIHAKATSKQSSELVWTGPTTHFVSTRRTEQALLQVINSAEHSLFLTSFVAYDVSSIVKALHLADQRGVIISMLLESSQENGGSIDIDVIGKMRNLVPPRTPLWLVLQTGRVSVWPSPCQSCCCGRKGVLHHKREPHRIRNGTQYGGWCSYLRWPDSTYARQSSAFARGYSNGFASVTYSG